MTLPRVSTRETRQGRNLIQDYPRRGAEARVLSSLAYIRPKEMPGAHGSTLGWLVSVYVGRGRLGPPTMQQQLASLQLCKKNGVRPDQRTGGGGAGMSKLLPTPRCHGKIGRSHPAQSVREDFLREVAIELVKKGQRGT